MKSSTLLERPKPHLRDLKDPSGKGLFPDFFCVFMATGSSCSWKTSSAACCSGSEAGAVGAVALFVVALCGLALKGLGSTGAVMQIQMYLSFF